MDVDSVVLKLFVIWIILSVQGGRLTGIVFMGGQFFQWLEWFIKIYNNNDSLKYFVSLFHVKQVVKMNTTRSKWWNDFHIV